MLPENGMLITCPPLCDRLPWQVAPDAVDESGPVAAAQASQKRKGTKPEHWSKKVRGEMFTLLVKDVPIDGTSKKKDVAVQMCRNRQTGLTESMEPGWIFTAKGGSKPLNLCAQPWLSLSMLRGHAAWNSDNLSRLTARVHFIARFQVRMQLAPSSDEGAD